MSEVRSEELLGHACFEDRHFPRPKKRYFERRFRNNKLSVDRMDESNTPILKLIQGKHASTLQGNNRYFYGWHGFKAETVLDNGGGTVQARPTPQNRWHADIIVEGQEELVEVSELLRTDAVEWIAVGLASSHPTVAASPTVLL